MFACFKELFSRVFATLSIFCIPSPSMQREALPTGAVKPDAEAEPKDQLEAISMCFRQSDLY